MRRPASDDDRDARRGATCPVPVLSPGAGRRTQELASRRSCQGTGARPRPSSLLWTRGRGRYRPTTREDREETVTVRPVRGLQQRRGWAWHLAVSIVRPTLLLTTKRTWIDGDKIPATGGCILVVNHVSHIDPLTTAHIVYDHGRLPRYLAKSGL